LPAKFNHFSDDEEMSRQDFCKRFVKKVPGDSSGDIKLECKACNKTFAQRNTKCHLQGNHAVMRPFGCEFCPRRFFLLSERVKHMRSKHPNENHCENCGKQFERAIQYAEHLKEIHDIDVGIVNNNEELDISDENMRYVKRATSVRQQKLSSDAPSIEKIDTSSSSSFTFQDLTCVICNIEFDSSRSYRSHMRDHGGGVEAMSIEMPLKTPVKIKQETKEANFQCDICEKKFLAVIALNAHKKFKHGVNTNGLPLASKQTPQRSKQIPTRGVEKHKFEIECEICDFKIHRRDYVENHNKQTHKEEFECHICRRVASDYNSFIFHMHISHSSHKLNLEKYYKCDKCEYDKYFKFEANRDKHRELKHAENRPKKTFFCESCNLNYLSKKNYDIHAEHKKHRSLKALFDNLRKNKVKPEKSESKFVHVDEPVVKKQRLDVESTPESGEDKLEYLKFLELSKDGSYKCGICGKSKATRKFLLHHLKQHNEVPTFNCHKCPERFVFRRKYEKHLEMHGCFAPKEPTVAIETSQEEREVIENEHPKFQDVKKEISTIKCEICDMSFKLKIQCNKHNTTWHAEENPNRHLSMQEQKNKNKEALGVVTLLRCKVCSHAFVKQEDLKNHMKLEHNSENVAVSEGEDQQKFSCTMCKLSFNEKQFLDNHTKLFCIHRNNEQIVKERSELIAVNEQ
jgi:Zinc finger, C2H2 type